MRQPVRPLLVWSLWVALSDIYVTSQPQDASEEQGTIQGVLPQNVDQGLSKNLLKQLRGSGVVAELPAEIPAGGEGSELGGSETEETDGGGTKAGLDLINQGHEIMQRKNSNTNPRNMARRMAEVKAYVRLHKDLNLAPTLKNIMSRESTHATSEQWPTVTVIINIYKREVLEQQIRALFAQTAASSIAEVWVCIFAAPAQEYALQVAKTLSESEGHKVRVVVSDFNFKFYGRFQLAYTAKTDYVWLIDDDIFPGKRYLEQLLHASGTKELRRSVLGSVGRVMPRPDPYMRLNSYRHWGMYGGLYLPDGDAPMHRGVPVDFLCSQWFLQRSWLSHMFSEAPRTFETGEDFHLSHTLLKYAGIQSFVMPHDENDPDTKGSTERGLAFISAATGSSEVPVRDAIWMGALKAGTSYRWTQLLSPTQSHVGPAVLFVVNTLADARALIPLANAYREASTRFGRSSWKVFYFSATVSCPDIVSAMSLPNPKKCSNYHLGMFTPTGNRMDGWQPFLDLREDNPAEFAVAVARNLKMVLVTLHAHAVVHVRDPEGGPISKAITAGIAAYNAGEIPYGPAADIEVPSSDVPYLQFLPHMKAAWLQHWATPKVEIHVITNDRLVSLKRLLDSLASAHYLGDEVSLHFHIDVDASVEQLNYLVQLEWPFGGKEIHHRVTRGGLIAAVSESWHPAGPDEYGLFLEDDISVSPGFYAWTKHLLLRYRYSSPDSYLTRLSLGVQPPNGLAGISLYTPRLEEVTGERKRLDFESLAGGWGHVLYQTPSSWGALYFPEVWAQLHQNVTLDLYKTVPKLLVNGWKSSWKKYLFSLMYHNRWFMLYPAYKEERSLATNHLEAGEHIGKASKIPHLPEDYTVPLFAEGDTSFFLETMAADLMGLAKIGIDGELRKPSTVKPRADGRRDLQDEELPEDCDGDKCPRELTGCPEGTDGTCPDDEDEDKEKE